LAGRQSKNVVEKEDFIQAVERSIAVNLSSSHTHAIQTHTHRHLPQKKNKERNPLKKGNGSNLGDNQLFKDNNCRAN